ncbi:MAG: hypothetical protein N2Z21_07735 [Candidatus Sumerlaeaceae bacterium]|nr:hypothetical protein [Candidatus Sumerlaeaceae bacterium]
MTKTKTKAFVLLAAIGILAILGMITFGLALNVDFTYRYARHRGGQRELAQILRAAAEFIAKDATLQTRLSQATSPEELFKLDDKATVVAKGMHVPQKLGAVLPGARCILVEAVSPRQPTLARQAIYAFQAGSAPVLLAEMSHAVGGGKK